MDVQLDNIDVPPDEAQPAGKIRKGFKLFGKRKPRSIFSLRRKGGENKSPVVGGNTVDAQDLEQVPEQEKESEEVSRGENGEGEGEEDEHEEPLGKDGVLAAAPPRHSISSTASAKSLSFLSLLRGGRRVAGDRRVHTVSQPVGRHRRGLRGLFGSVRFLQKETEDKDEAPPSPLLMSSRANSVEIIKEDLTLTPKAQPRSVDGPDTCEPEAGVAARATTVSKPDEHAPPLPTAQPPMEPGDSSLSSLLADISSLLTFDSISGGGDIMADVEAEWGKASAAISAMETRGRSPLSSPSKAVSSSPLSSPSSISVTSVVNPSPFTSLSTFATFTTKPAVSSSPITNPSLITTSYTLAMPSLKYGSASTAPATEATKMTTFIKSSTLSTATTNPAPVISASFSPPLMSCPLKTMKSSPYSTSFTTAVSQPPAAVVKSSTISPTLTSTAGKSRPEYILNTAPASIPSSTRSPPTPIAFSIPLSAKLDSTNTSASQKTFQSSITRASNAPASTSVASSLVVQAIYSSSATVVTYKMPVDPAAAPLSSSATLSSYTQPIDPTALDKDNSALVSTPFPEYTNTTALQSSNKRPPSPPPIRTSSITHQSTVKHQPSPPPFQIPASFPVTSVKLQPTPAPIQTSATPPLSSDKLQTTPAPIQTFATPPLSSVKLQTTPDPIQTSATPPLSSVKLQTTPAPIQTSATPPLSSVKLQTTPDPIQTSATPPLSSVKLQTTPAPIQTSATPPLSSVKLQTAPAPIQMPSSTPVSSDKIQPTHTPIPTSSPVPLDRVSTSSTLTPVSVSLEKNPPISMPNTISKVALPAQTLATSLSNTGPLPNPPSSTSIPNSFSKTPAVVVPDTRHPFSHPPIPASLLGVAQSSARIKDANQASVDGGLTSPNTMNATGPQTILQKREEPHANLQGPTKDKRTPPTKSGLSKIPVVGGGKAGKLPVREPQSADEESSSDPPTPVLEEERPRLGLQSGGGRDHIYGVEASVHLSKHSPDECQRLQLPKAISGAPRDSKIPVKQGAHVKDAPRTKITVSKVPVRRIGNKTYTAGTGIPIRK